MNHIQKTHTFDGGHLTTLCGGFNEETDEAHFWIYDDIIDCIECIKIRIKEIPKDEKVFKKQLYKADFDRILKD